MSEWNHFLAAPPSPCQFLSVFCHPPPPVTSDVLFEWPFGKNFIFALLITESVYLLAFLLFLPDVSLCSVGICGLKNLQADVRGIFRKTGKKNENNFTAIQIHYLHCTKLKILILLISTIQILYKTISIPAKENEL